MIKCMFENGAEASLRHLVVDAVITKGNDILLVKRAGKLLEGGKWGLAGGFVERDETAQQAVRREVLEETGWSVKDLTLMMINTNPNRPKEDRQNVSLVFAGAAVKKIGESDWESDEVKWFPFDRLPPAASIAFDHLDYIKLYLETQSRPATWPVLV